MFDNHEPFKELEAFDFRFNPRNFEIYFNGQLQKKGSTELILGGKKNENDGLEKISIFIGDISNSLDSQIKTSFSFDKVVTSTDRIVLFKIPEFKSHNQMGMLATMFGITRESYNFEQNEPYTCSVFTQNGNITKLSFNLYNNKLIELY